MKNIAKLVALVALLALMLGPQASVFANPGSRAGLTASPRTAKPAAAAVAGHYQFDFANTVKPWASAADTGATGSYLELNTKENACPSLQDSGSAILKGTLAPSMLDSVPQPVGTWMHTAFPGGGLVRVSISFSARNVSDCAGCVPRVYVGAKAPTRISQFGNTESYLKDYWQTFKADRVIDLKDSKSFYVAIGWAGTNSSIGLDCVSIDVSPLNSGTPPTPTPAPTNQ